MAPAAAADIVPASSSTHGEHYSNAVKQLLAVANQAKLPAAPLQLITLHDVTSSPAAASADLQQLYSCGPNSIPLVQVPKRVTEYPMPGAGQTHEMAVVGENMLLVTQQSNSTLVKVQLDPITGRPLSCARFLLGDFWAGLHGLAASQLHPGHVWASMQFKSILVRINVGRDQATAPTVEQVIQLPPSVYGPHCVCECGPNHDLWTSCKDSSHIVRISQTDPSDFSVYPCSRHPIFMAMHPTSHDFYASLDTASRIWRLDSCTGETTELDIPATHGHTPVGLVAGPDGNVWFTLLGGADGGIGTFARILPNAQFQFFALTTPIASDAGLIHLAFDWDYHLSCKTQDAEASNATLRLWLLASSLIANVGKSIDAVFTVLIDGRHGHITTQHSIALPTQLSATHRILPHRTGLFVSQLSVSSLAYITGTAALKPTDVVSEATDKYNTFGLGQSLPRYVFSKELTAIRGSLLGPPLESYTTGKLPPSGRVGKRPRIAGTFVE